MGKSKIKVKPKTEVRKNPVYRPYCCQDLFLDENYLIIQPTEDQTMPNFPLWMRNADWGSPIDECPYCQYNWKKEREYFENLAKKLDFESQQELFDSSYKNWK